jgi:hypothetical protein
VPCQVRIPRRVRAVGAGSGAHAALGAHLARAALGVHLGGACHVKRAPRVHILGAGGNPLLAVGARREGVGHQKRNPSDSHLGRGRGGAREKKNTPSISHLR